MASILVRPASSVSGVLAVPGDKSISHRAIILGALSHGPTTVEHFLESSDSFRTLEAFRKMGVSIEKLNEEQYLIKGVGLHGLSAPREPLQMGESGTTMRLLLGVLAGQSFRATLAADASLARRPMLRVVTPLRQMGARIEGKNGGEYAPITIQGVGLRPIRYESPIASAQVKSAILLAGLYAAGETVITEPYLSRDHTERLLVRFGVPVRQQGKSISMKGPARLMGQKIRIPGDFSSAAFFIAAASIIPNSSLLLKDVNLNPTRTGLLTVLSQMGARVQVIHKEVTDEPRGDLQIVSSVLKGTTVPAELLPTLIDEVPILMVAASLAEGTTAILGAGELRVKETDRIVSMATGLRSMGGQVITKGNDVVIQGVGKLHAARVHSYGDHRTAMSLAVAGLTTEGETTVEDADCITKSFPAFARCLESVKRN